MQSYSDDAAIMCTFCLSIDTSFLLLLLFVCVYQQHYRLPHTLVDGLCFSSFAVSFRNSMNGHSRNEEEPVHLLLLATYFFSHPHYECASFYTHTRAHLSQLNGPSELFANIKRRPSAFRPTLM